MAVPAGMVQCRNQEAFEGWFLGLHGPGCGLSNEEFAALARVVE